jgi:chorismate lyase
LATVRRFLFVLQLKCLIEVVMMPPDYTATELLFVSTPFISLDAQWQDACSMVLPRELAPWVLETASLTARLKRHCKQFRLQLLQEKRASLPVFLQHLLPGSLSVQVREVILWCDDQPCVYAQSWLPEKTINTLQPLAELGERPLGDYIFQHQSLQRGRIEAAMLQLNLPQFTTAASCLARRSVFQLEQQPLLVAEAFLPATAMLREVGA